MEKNRTLKKLAKHTAGTLKVTHKQFMKMYLGNQNKSTGFKNETANEIAFQHEILHYFCTTNNNNNNNNNNNTCHNQ